MGLLSHLNAFVTQWHTLIIVSNICCQQASIDKKKKSQIDLLCIEWIEWIRKLSYCRLHMDNVRAENRDTREQYIDVTHFRSSCLWSNVDESIQRRGCEDLASASSCLRLPWLGSVYFFSLIRLNLSHHFAFCWRQNDNGERNRISHTRTRHTRNFDRNLLSLFHCFSVFSVFGCGFVFAFSFDARVFVTLSVGAVCAHTVNARANVSNYPKNGMEQRMDNEQCSPERR